MDMIDASNGIQIGDWAIGTDENGNLAFTNKGTTGQLVVNGSQVVTSGNVITLANDQGFLNGTKKVGGPGDGWSAAAYWQSYNPPDGDSNLKITIVS